MFAKFRKVIMVWKRVDNLQTGPPSITEHVGNVVDTKSNKEGFKYSVDTGGDETRGKTSYADIFRG